MNRVVDGPEALRGAAPAGPEANAWLERLDVFIAREIARLRSRYQLSLDEFRGLYVSDAQVDALVMQAAPAVLHVAPPAACEPLPGSRLAHVAQAFALDDDELDLLQLALACELSPKYETLFAYLNNDVTRKWPTGELAQRLFAQDAAHGRALRQCLSPDAPLFAAGLLETVASTREAPRAQRGLRVCGALADWLMGLEWQDERLSGIAHGLPAPPGARLDATNGLHDSAQVLASVIRRRDAIAPVLVISAASAADARCAAVAAVEAFGGVGDRPHPPIALDLLALRHCPAPLEAVAALCLQQRMFGVAVIASPVDALLDNDGRPVEAPGAALRRLVSATHAGLPMRPLLLCASAGQRWRELLGDARSLEVNLPELSVRQRALAWREALASDAATLESDVGDDALLALADRFVLGPERIARAVLHAQDLAHAAGSDRPSAAHLVAAARAASVEGNSEVVRTVRQPFSWPDLVLPPEVQQRLRDLVHAVALRPVVYDRWNFARPAGGQRGIKAMFAGASGTGKTMAAAIVAGELGLELHRVELAAVMSKYIGETEKNLERAFAAARRANAILFIDEADALLGKRSEVRDAHDRYANVEVAFLLQKMEDHDGVVIIATNLAHNIDAAFSRRMQFVITFPLPDVGARERLWQAMFPPEAPRGDDLDIGFLARQFSFAGGDIRNIALEAAFRSAHQGKPIGMREVLAAVVAHYAKRGKLPSANEFGHYAAVFAAGHTVPSNAPSNA